VQGFLDEIAGQAAPVESAVEPVDAEEFLGVEDLCGDLFAGAGHDGLSTTGTGVEADRDRAFADFVKVIDRAKAAGTLRADFVPEDLPLFLMANAGILAATADAATDSALGATLGAIAALVASGSW
jgi:hypothetical protein